MNKYLLLRDNKQSGPYTVSEIIEIGIKPYDLVWHDGKSISWRYPSEIEELKPYAPVVEEQPFDRFYKKPQAVEKTAPALIKTEHAAYVPKAAEANSVEEIAATKKVYINFPAHAQAQPEKRQPPATTQYIPPVSYQKEIEDRPSFPERNTASYSAKPTKDNKQLYYAGAAAIVLIGFITVLLINNRNQQAKLRELNTIVKEIESKNVHQASTQQASLTGSVQPAAAAVPPATSETIVNPELLADNDYSKPTTGEKNEVAPEATPAVEPKKQDAPSPGVVYKERPVLRRGDNENAQSVKTETVEPVVASTENVFKLVSVTAGSYKTGVLGGISNLQLHLTNNSKQELHKVAIVIKYLGPEKKVVNTQTVYFENVAPGKNATIDVPKSKRGVSIDYAVTDIKS